MKVLITGGAGYIGSHTCVALLDAGHDIVVLDSFANSKPESLRRVAEICGKDFAIYNVDLLNQFEVEDVFAREKLDAVIHFAGYKAVGESVSQPLKYYHNNFTGTVILCEVMQKFGVTKMVFSSSATVYGTSDDVPFTEDMPVAAINPYGQTKVMLEQVLRDLCEADSAWRVAALRYFNPVGAHESGLIGEDPNGVPSNLLPYVTQVAIGRLPELTIHGDDYPTPDGTCIRDYIHVMDLAEGHVKALESLVDKPGFEIYNLGTGVGSSVLEVVHAFEEASGVKIPRRIGPRRPGDAPVSYADVSKAQRELGWRAKYNLVQMCADAWNWQLKNPNGFAGEAEAGL
ncbi:UDP-glucose 4-epimerase GalE [Alicyclobacillus acidoterrestris]|uniref:UDP-glucose 4-epimerase n=1 Tax=Alicyclobacillus acidoterrestris (strain ATCC 49025 / DSM 3922 / CIP 106132 / NCIMB 13137 / GD3B) TaxID=1356854 RepID=T0C0H9_ALIAG|nr:UDP-glucose 4-epimerase GalE [Alicyclobacillus acidoterrestris]EPZ46115.1 hypothetical protein N007_07505 [Alicyclobacillus acidoterrestris ATCC 49025]UNO48487.1 UDP-glucose 4-epimerase GalE [Alicyclobacillus acidoterrestris]